MNKFFVYGTLMSGCSNHRVIPSEAIESIEAATINGMELYSVPCANFPAMIDGNRTVVGEVITIKDDHFIRALMKMDYLEGFESPGNEHNFYNREIREAILEDGSKTEVYVYLFNDKSLLGDLIESGNFKQLEEVK